MDLGNGYFSGRDSKGIFHWNEKELIRIKESDTTKKKKKNELPKLPKK